MVLLFCRVFLPLTNQVSSRRATLSIVSAFTTHQTSSPSRVRGRSKTKNCATTTAILSARLPKRTASFSSITCGGITLLPNPGIWRKEENTVPLRGSNSKLDMANRSGGRGRRHNRGGRNNRVEPGGGPSEPNQAGQYRFGICLCGCWAVVNYVVVGFGALFSISLAVTKASETQRRFGTGENLEQPTSMN